MNDEEKASGGEDEEPKLGGSGTWWDVTLSADVCGQLTEMKTKGRARRNSRRNLGLGWSFSPSTKSAATRSPTFEYLGLGWCLRFQRSPYDSGIPHPPAWSIFLDLLPPYGKNVFRVNGMLHLKHEQGLVRLWKFDKEYVPAWPNQEVCTWVRKRLDLDKYVKARQSDGNAICLQLDMSAIGLGREFQLSPIQSTIEALPFTLKVGTTTFSRRFGWDIRPHLNELTEDQLTFWKSMQESKIASKKLKFGPVDLAKALSQDEIHSITTWRVCDEFKTFIVDGIHNAPSGFVVIPYHLIFLDFDLMDGSDNEDSDERESPMLDLRSRTKHHITVSLLDWIVRNPLVAAADGRDFLTEKDKAQCEKMLKCFNCQTSHRRDAMSKCSRCRTAWYCSVKCQHEHWKTHKKECKTLAKEHAKNKKLLRLEDKVAEEKRASDIQDDLMDARLKAMMQHTSQTIAVIE